MSRWLHAMLKFCEMRKPFLTARTDPELAAILSCECNITGRMCLHDATRGRYPESCFMLQRSKMYNNATSGHLLDLALAAPRLIQNVGRESALAKADMCW